MTTWSRWPGCCWLLTCRSSRIIPGNNNIQCARPRDAAEPFFFGSERMQVLNRTFSRGAWCGAMCEKIYHVWKSTLWIQVPPKKVLYPLNCTLSAFLAASWIHRAKILWWKFEPATCKLKVAKFAVHGVLFFFPGFSWWPSFGHLCMSKNAIHFSMRWTYVASTKATTFGQAHTTPFR